MLNGRRVDVSHRGFILFAVGVEASKKMVSIYFYGKHNYKHIIEKNTNLEIGDCYLTWFNEANDSYKIFKCHNYENEAKEMIKAFLGK